MLKTILLVIDGQSADHGSVELALRWSSQYDAMLVGHGMIEESAVHSLEPVPLGAGEARRELDAARLHQQQVLVESGLSAIAVRCARAGVTFKPLESVGRAAEEIGVEAQRADVIVIPRHVDKQQSPSQSHASTYFRTILSSAPRPVVAAAEEAPAGPAVVVAYDGSLQAARTLYALEASGLAAGKPVHVLTINDDQPEAARQGQRAVEFLAAHAIRATLEAKPRADRAEQIMDFARETDAGLIALGAFGQPRIREFFLGSVTSDVLAKCTIPLFLFH
jgi:nucleotide-binding universal stress UspA family protein